MLSFLLEGPKGHHPRCVHIKVGDMILTSRMFIKMSSLGLNPALVHTNTAFLLLKRMMASDDTCHNLRVHYLVYSCHIKSW